MAFIKTGVFMHFTRCAMKAFMVTLLTMSSLFVYGQSISPIEIPKIEGEISIDAKLDEPQWKNAKKVLVNNITRPYDNIPSMVNTEALLMEDGGTFYIAFIAEDPDPSQIRAYLKDRDRSWGDDIVGIKIDTYNEQREAYRFLVNALGVQIDGIESEITKRESDAWDGIWSSYGRITDTGYIVEMALPLRMLNFNEGLDKQIWAIELVRFYPRDERFRISNIRLERGNSCELCQMVPAIGFSGAKQGENLTITPSLVVGANQQRDNPQEDWEDDNTVKPSLDIRWGITPDILLNATLNPDFSTVEADNAQLSINNNFALFNQEKRPFFLDNADYFDTNYNLVHTRNINAPNYGAKLTAKHNDHSVGLFITDDSSTNMLIPGNRSSSIAEIDEKSHDAALRYRYNYDENITIGWLSALRTADDYHNIVNGIDARFRLNPDDVIKFQQVFSNTEYPEDLYEQFCDSDYPEDCAPDNTASCALGNCDTNESVLRTQKDGDFSGNAFRAGYYHTDRDWEYNATYHKQNENFRGDLGFISRVDFNNFRVAVKRKWYSEVGEWWNFFDIYSDWEIAHNDDDELIEKEFDFSLRLRARYESFFNLGFKHREQVGDRIDQSNLAIDGNTTLFTEDRFHFFGEIKPIAGLYLNTQLQYGDQIDFSNNRLGTVKQVRPTINWNVNEHLEMKLRYTFRHLDADGSNVFIARLADFRATYQFNVRSFIRASVIYNNTSQNPNNYPLSDPEDIDKNSKYVSTELLYAYKLNPQTVFYLGYSDNHDNEHADGLNIDFNEIEQTDRSIFMKFSYAWMK